MSAHVYTALQQCQQFPVNFDHLQSALNFSCWTESLSLDEYREMQDIVSRKDEPAFRAFVERLLPIYHAAWEELDKPTTREEWVNQLYKQVCGK